MLRIMKRKDAEYLYGSLEAYYGIAVAGSLFFGVIGFILQIFINGSDDVFEKAAFSSFCAGGIFLLGTFEVTLDIIMNKKQKD